ncbi:MAG: hypothetical protein KF900_08335 [Bacteroidetes bacterium]|nr:hypothetical protein [Bacteroidota bacterium]
MKQIDSSKIIKTTTFDTITGEVVEKLLGFEVKKKFGEKYSGYYQYYTNSNSVNILHGQFYFSYADSGYYTIAQEIDSSMFWITKISYSGEYRENKKQGKFTEKLLDDDGIDLYSDWEITLNFENNNCKGANFVGAIGNSMPITTYNFPNINTCSFSRVLFLSEEKWGKDWEINYNPRTH